MDSFGAVGMDWVFSGTGTFCLVMCEDSQEEWILCGKWSEDNFLSWCCCHLKGSRNAHALLVLEVKECWAAIEPEVAKVSEGMILVSTGKMEQQSSGSSISASKGLWKYVSRGVERLLCEIACESAKGQEESRSPSWRNLQQKKGALAASGSDTEQGLIGRLRVKVEMILTNVTC